MKILTLGGIPWGLATSAALGLAMQIRTSDAAVQDRPIDLGAGQSLEQLTGETGLPLQITGFGTGGYSLDGRTNDNTFLASKFTTSLFRELSESFWMFGQLTTLLEGHHGSERPFPSCLWLSGLAKVEQRSPQPDPSALPQSRTPPRHPR